MKKILLGAIVGAFIGYHYKEMKERGDFNQLSDDVNGIAHKAKRELKNAMGKGRNQAEYLKDRAEDEIEKGFDKVDEATR